MTTHRPPRIRMHSSEEEEDALMRTVSADRNPLATTMPEWVDSVNATQLTEVIEKLPVQFRNRSFSVNKATVIGNETVIRVTGLNSITLDQWSKHIPSRYLAGGHFSFDGLNIHIPFRRVRNRKRCLRFVAVSIVVCIVTLAILLAVHYMK
jgi:hypothetical protein